MAKKILAGLMLLVALASTPAFADADDVPVQVQMNNGVVRVMKLERAQRIQARGEGIIIGGVAPYGVYSTGSYVYPSGYRYPISTYAYPSGYTYPTSTYVYPYSYGYPYSNIGSYPRTYSSPYYYRNGTWWSVPNTNGAGHPHQYEYNYQY